jgi:hypothetical protein
MMAKIMPFKRLEMTGESQAASIALRKINAAILGRSAQIVQMDVPHKSLDGFDMN